MSDKGKAILFLVVVVLASWTFGFSVSAREATSKLGQPPAGTGVPVDVRAYLKDLYDNHNLLGVVTTNPDGSRRGKLGQMVLFNDSGTYYLEICTSSGGGTQWRGAILANLP